MTDNFLKTIKTSFFGILFCLFSVPSIADYWTLPIPLQGKAPNNHFGIAKNMKASACGQCHPKQIMQWRQSLHSQAISPGLLGQLEAFDKDTQATCLNCHAPLSEQQISLLEGSNFQNAKTSGVDCAGCHVRQHQRFSAKEKKITPHSKVIAKSLFTSSKFCSSCHQFSDEDQQVNGKLLENTYLEWQQSSYAKQGISCQQCHMPNGNHYFKGIHNRDFLKKGLSIKVKRHKTGITITLNNKGAGHYLPTYITPQIRLVVTDDENIMLKQWVIQRAMDWQRNKGWQEHFDTRLAPNESRLYQLPLSGNTKVQIKVIVAPDFDYISRVYPYLIKQLQGEISHKAMQQLILAKITGSKSTYVAYVINCSNAQNNQCTEVKE